MFGQLRPKPDARMLRRVAARLRVRAGALRAGRGHAGAPEGGALDRHAHGLDAALRSAAASRRLARIARQRPLATRGKRASHWPKPAYVYARIGSLRQLDHALDDALLRPACRASPATPRTRGRSRRSRASPTRPSCSAPLERARRSPPARKRPRPGERRVQILQTLATMLEQPGAERITTAALAAKLDVSRGRAVPPLRQQGADVRGADRVHRAERLHARQPDRRARDRRRARRRSRIARRCCCSSARRTRA